MRRWPFLFAAIFVFSAAARAGVVAPSGLAPGDTYRLIFVTDSSILGSDPNIADYNAFVTAAANSDPGLAALNTSWTALLSTFAVNVLDNTSLSATDSSTPFYNTLGQLIATGVFNGDDGLYDSGDGFDSHSAQILDPSGVTTTSPYALVWTGTLPEYATTFPAFAVGFRSALAGDSTMLQDGWTRSDNYFTTNALAVYGISGLLTVPTPEPSTLGTAGLAAAALLGLARARRGRAGF